MASVLEDGFRAPEEAWSLRDRKEREIKDGRKGVEQRNEAQVLLKGHCIMMLKVMQHYKWWISPGAWDL